MKRIIITCIVCLAIGVFGIHTTNAAEPIRDCGAADPMSIIVGDIIDCGIDSIGDSRSFLFNASAGDKIRLTMTDMTTGIPRPRLFLYDTDGDRMSYWDVNDGGRHIDYSLTETGRYNVVIGEYGDNELVEFRIALQGIIPSPSEARRLCHDDQYEDDIDPFADSDVFFFNGTAGDSVRLTMTDMTIGIPRPRLFLYDTDGDRISYWDVNDGGRHIDYSLTETGRYNVVIGEYGDNESVIYRLAFHCISGNCWDCPGDPPPNVTCNGQDVTILGTEGNDIIIGTDGPDVIHGLGSVDIIRGMGGDDIICGGDGSDYIGGVDGNDIIIGGAGHDAIWGGPGNDIIRGEEGHDIIFGGPGNDDIYGGEDHDVLSGLAGDDLLEGGYGNDCLYGGDGVDVLNAGAGPDNNDTCYDEAGTSCSDCEVFYEE